jgi:hypothetical protein
MGILPMILGHGQNLTAPEENLGRFNVGALIQRRS